MPVPLFVHQISNSVTGAFRFEVLAEEQTVPCNDVQFSLTLECVDKM